MAPLRPPVKDGRQPAWRGWSAERVLTRGQAALGVALVGALAAGLVVDRVTAVSALVALLIVVSVVSTGLRLVYCHRGYRRPVAPAPLPPGALPRYTVLAALYREANVVPALLDALDALEYPADRLQVAILVEHDDPETIAACEPLLRPGWTLVRVPEGRPRTKPRALNAGLEIADGELLTIYDAEDRPEPDQLLRAAATFAAAPAELACLQARLDYYNTERNVLTRWFACEYALHFSLLLDGIAASGHPMPLGGTSTHFRTAALREIGGWDAWNVTEDCEVGMRLAAAGHAAGTLDSVTWEEAVSSTGPWIRQRSRWIKGFAQTALAMLRRPGATAIAMGPRRYLAALVVVGGLPVVLLTQVAFWGLLWVYIGMRTAGVDVAPIESVFPAVTLYLGSASLFIGNFAILLFTVAALYQQRRYELVRWAVLLPPYWLLASVAAWRAVAQLVRRPHHWEKTEHGVRPEAGEDALALLPVGEIAVPPPLDPAGSVHLADRAALTSRPPAGQ